MENPYTEWPDKFSSYFSKLWKQMAFVTMWTIRCSHQDANPINQTAEMFLCKNGKLLSLCCNDKYEIPPYARVKYGYTIANKK